MKSSISSHKSLFLQVPALCVIVAFVDGNGKMQQRVFKVGLYKESPDEKLTNQMNDHIIHAIETTLNVPRHPLTIAPLLKKLVPDSLVDGIPASWAGSGIVLFTTVFWVPNFWVPFQLLRTEKNPTGDRNQFVLRYTKNTKYPLSLNRSSVCLCACCCTLSSGQWVSI